MPANSASRIAILGSTSHIAQGLIHAFCATREHELLLYAREPERTAEFLKTLPGRVCATAGTIESFELSECDVVINCIGAGDPAKVGALGSGIFSLTETFDNRVMNYLFSHPTTLYINFSSGAVYGTIFADPAGDNAKSAIDMNHLRVEDWYGIAKLHSEAKHRAVPDFRIIDLRIFSYFSRFIDHRSRFLLAEAICCIREKRVLETGPENIVRDYLHPDDLHAMVMHCIEAGPRNEAFDVCSLKPATKFQALELLSHRYGLQYKISERARPLTATGMKMNYYSTSMKARSIGFVPRYTSLDCIRLETEAILAQKGTCR